MIYNFVPDIIRNKIESATLGQNLPNTKTQASFYEFLINSRPDFDIQNNTFNFFMPINITQCEFECTSWDTPCQQLIPDDLAKLLGQRYCGHDKFCVKELIANYEPSTYTVKVDTFAEIDNIPSMEITNVKEAWEQVAINLLSVVQKRLVYVADELPNYGKIQRRIQIVLDENILFIDELKTAIYNELSQNLSDIAIEFETVVKITPLFELAKLFDLFYTDLIKKQFSPLFGMRVLIHKDLTILPLTFSTDIIQKLNTFKTLPAVVDITFADKYISWQPLTMQINAETGIMAILIKKLEEQNFTFEQFLELQLRTVKYPPEP